MFRPKEGRLERQALKVWAQQMRDAEQVKAEQVERRWGVGVK